jgi:hypothetical protein
VSAPDTIGDRFFAALPQLTGKIGIKRLWVDAMCWLTRRERN